MKTINISDLKPEQIQHIEAIISAFKAKNQLDNNKSQFDMISYLLENPLEVDDLQFMTREEIYDRKS
ncbi:hypothetical protein H6G11_10535 [Cyanobacterium aponinum FACHB-4101]|uniref:hypothetical protein n=1 Tax=Cyanobacterium aponinum TaxID=379064 RepID=UPI0016812648|nr:hypothetical protein [Cyanobacterium aponinum]MBD2394687.1 hypothetical protein [Cyanobacterium aponinum FACHB-4101]